MNLLKIKSRGLIVVLIFNLFISGLFWWASSNILKANFQNPIFTSFVDSIPTIVIKDETVVEPVNMNASRTLGDIPFLYIQTDRDYVGVGAIQDGIYITRKAVTVFIQGNTLSQIELPDEGVITPQKIHQFLAYLITWVPVVIALIYMAVLWAFYLILVGFNALVGLLMKKYGKVAPTHSAWRSAMVAMLIVLIIDFAAGYFGYALPVLTIYGWPVPLFIQWIIAFVLAIALMNLEAFIGNNETKTTEHKKKKLIK